MIVMYALWATQLKRQLKIFCKKNFTTEFLFILKIFHNIWIAMDYDSMFEFVF
jgi:hypothetical protein